MSRLFNYLSSNSTTNAMQIGGYGSAHTADLHIQSIVDHLKNQINAHSGYNLTLRPLIAISYTSQVVSGTNYKIKVSIGGNECIHISVYQPLPYTGAGPQLTDIKFNKTMRDPLV